MFIKRNKKICYYEDYTNEITQRIQKYKTTPFIIGECNNILN